MEGSSGGESPRRTPKSAATVEGNKGRSCKGCLYFSSIRKASDRKPICFGLSRSLKQVPGYMVGESELEASKEGRNLSDFKYVCVGYSLFAENKDNPTGKQEKPAELPFCVGIELLVDKRVVKQTNNTPAHAHNKEDIHTQPGGFRPPSSSGQEFLNRFTRNAGLVASGVSRNLHKVGNYVKDNIDDILYPYRRRPK